MKHTAPTSRRHRTQAREALFYSSNWISALLVTYSLLLLFFSTVELTDCLLVLSKWLQPMMPWIRWGLYLVQYLLFSPLLVGQLCFYADLYRAAHGDLSPHVPPAVIFTLYATPRAAVRAWGQVLAVCVLCASIPVSAIPTLTALRLVYAERIGIFPAVLLVLGGITAFLCTLYFNARLTPFLYISVSRPELSLFDAVRRSWTLTADRALTGVMLQLRLLLSAVISVFLSAGVLFFLYVLPIAVFTYISFCHELSRRYDLF